MLVLTRRVGERLLIGDDIEVVVLEVKGENVRLGIQAPREARIQRAEIVAAVERENVEAARSDAATEAALRDALVRRAGVAVGTATTAGADSETGAGAR